MPRSSSDAIDRSSAFERNLGSGISSCDGPTAIFVFNRGTETSTVLTGIDAVAKAHGNFMRAETWPHESGVRDVLHSSSDKNRELVLTVLVFHVRYSETVMPDARVDGEWQETPEPAVRWSNLTGGNQPKTAAPEVVLQRLLSVVAARSTDGDHHKAAVPRWLAQNTIRASL